MIVPYGAGGPTDVVARLLGQRLAEISGQPFVIENHPGASAITGTRHAARAPADGYTLLFVVNDFAAQPSLTNNAQYDPRTSFTPVTTVATSPEVIVVHPSIPATSLAELLALVRARPGQYHYASPGTNSTTQLSAMRLFNLIHKLDLRHVPYAGGGPAVVSTIGGHSPIAVVALGAATPYIKDGMLRPLAVMSPARSGAIPDVPTLAEAGVPDHVSEIMIGVVVATGTPMQVVDWLQQQIARILNDKAIANRLAALGFEPVADKTSQFAQRIEAEIEKWAKVVADAGMTPK